MRLYKLDIIRLTDTSVIDEVIEKVNIVNARKGNPLQYSDIRIYSNSKYSRSISKSKTFIAIPLVNWAKVDYRQLKKISFKTLDENANYISWFNLAIDYKYISVVFLRKYKKYIDAETPSFLCSATLLLKNKNLPQETQEYLKNEII